MEVCSERYTAERIRALAKTACLGLSAEEESRLSLELGKMLTLADVLSEVPREWVSVCTTTEVALEELRPDVVKDSLTVEEVLSLSPIADSTYFRVPRIVEECS